VRFLRFAAQMHAPKGKIKNLETIVVSKFFDLEKDTSLIQNAHTFGLPFEVYAFLTFSRLFCVPPFVW